MNTLIEAVLIVALAAVAVLFVVRAVAHVRRAVGNAANPPGELPAARPETPAGAGCDAPALASAGVDQLEGRAA